MHIHDITAVCASHAGMYSRQIERMVATQALPTLGAVGSGLCGAQSAQAVVSESRTIETEPPVLLPFSPRG
ncbi:MAG TPA: hypothetical protein VNJ09_00840 [Chthonomonadales bacterium]|nr:hypothetical protein [Chthonomonadales bacterium]